MKKASETNEIEILDEANLHLRGEAEWDSLGGQTRTPLDLLMEKEDFEEGDDEDLPGRAGVLEVILDLCLDDWGWEFSCVRIGERARGVASAVSHEAGRGFLPMLGARKRVLAAGGREDVRRILDWLFAGPEELVPLGKRVVAIGKFVGHATFDDWSMSALGRACGETPQAMQERMEVVCEAPLRAWGSKGKAPWQQGERQRARSAVAQKRFYEDKKIQKERLK